MLLLFFFHGAQDALVFILILPGFAALSGAFIFVEIYRRYYRSEFQSKLILHIFYVGVLHGLIMIAVLLSQDLSFLLQSAFYHSDKALASWNLRSPGILLEGFGRLSIAQALTLICGIALLLPGEEKSRFHGNVKILFGSLVILFSIIISGKTGLVLFVVGLALFGWLIITGKRRLIASKSKKFVMVSVGLMVLFIFVIFSYNYNMGPMATPIWNGLEMLFSFKESGTFRTRSTDTLFERMYYSPDGWLSNLIGTGNYIQGSDVGFVCVLFGAGIIGIASVFAFYVHLGVKAFTVRKRNYMLAWIMVFFCLAMIIVNFKDFTLADMLGLSQIFSLCYVLLISSYQNRLSAGQLKPYL